MDKFKIRGGVPLNGRVRIEGSKNATLPIMAASLLADDVCTIGNVPYIEDVITMEALLRGLGLKINRITPDTFEIDSRSPVIHIPDEILFHKMRASYYLLGALLGRYGEATIYYPGGCSIGPRPMDYHFKALEAMGAEFSVEHGIIKAMAKHLEGATVFVDYSVGATLNVMLAAVLADGITIIENAAKEPHIVDTSNFLNLMGASIKGAGTDRIRIYGVDKLHSCEYTVIPDQIATGTYMLAGAATGGTLRVEGVIPKHMEALMAKMLEMGIDVTNDDDSITVCRKSKLRAINLKTSVYPGFPTDLQQPISSLLCVADGTSIITETVFDARFKHLDQLSRMGAKVKSQDDSAFITGVSKLTGARVEASDLRAGAALVIAGLIAEGVTEIEQVCHIDRGYMDIVSNLRAAGADIVRIGDNQAEGRIQAVN